MKIVKTIVLLSLLSCLIGCEQFQPNKLAIGDRPISSIARTNPDNDLAEVPSPKVIKELSQDLEQYKPQVKIAAPIAEKTFNQTDVEIKLEVENLPIFQDDQFHLGNHLNLIVDNEPLQEIYSLDEPILIRDLSPGTHTIRVFAVRPWGESFKNKGAYAQTTFNILTETNDNRPITDFPQLTYSSPTGTYGAEPVLLDFYLDHLDIQKWLVKATVNGTSFTIEDWQPYYLTGFKLGENWIQLELIDESGKTIENTFNNTVRVFTYDPQQQDTLAKLINDEISVADARGIVNQSYYIQPVITPEIIEPTLEIEPEPNFNAEESAHNIELTKDKIKTIKSEEGILGDTSAIEEKNNLSQGANSDVEQILTKKSEQTTIILAPETNIIDKVSKTTKDSSEKESNRVDLKDTEEENTALEPTESPEKITIIQDNIDQQKPIVTIKTPQPESTAITEDEINEISITLPQTESIEIPEQKTKSRLWWKKILISLRQKLENLVKLIPNEI